MKPIVNKNNNSTLVFRLTNLRNNNQKKTRKKKNKKTKSNSNNLKVYTPFKKMKMKTAQKALFLQSTKSNYRFYII